MIEKPTAALDTAFHDQRLSTIIQEIDQLDDTKDGTLENTIYGAISATLLTAPPVTSLFLTKEVGAFFAYWHPFTLTDSDVLTAYLLAFICQIFPMALIFAFALTVKNRNIPLAVLIATLWLPFAATSALGQYLYLAKYSPHADGAEQLANISRAVICTLIDLVAAVLLMSLQRKTTSRHTQAQRRKAKAIQEATEANIETRQRLAAAKQRDLESEREIDRRQREYEAVAAIRDQIMAAGLAALAGQNISNPPGVERRGTWGA